MNARLIDARFVARLNRFRVRVDRDGTAADAHLPNPGRLEELLVPGAAVRLLPASAPYRTTAYDVLAVRRGGQWVCLDTRLANVVVGEALEAHALPGFSRYREIRPEARWRDSRFDFLLEDPGRCWIEVKSCSLVRGGRALFPDAPTLRGTKHVDHLAALARRGDRAALVFVVMRRADRLSPNDGRDPAFGEALRKAVGVGVEIHAWRASLRADRLSLRLPVPIDL